MRKMMQICRQEEFNQRTFYKWLQESGYIEKSEAGYVTAAQAPSGMENLVYSFTYADGTIQERSQVTVAEELIPQLIADYLVSGYDRLYSTRSKNRQVTLTDDEEVPKKDALEMTMEDIKLNVKEIKQMLTEVLS